jgi:diamine N-acetyltransferase
MGEAIVTLREITAETMRAICELDVSPEQREYVAPNVRSIAEAYFNSHAWFRAVYADETPVGFVMVHEGPERVFLWRFMIDREHQGKGYGRRALDLVVEQVRETSGRVELLSSYVEGADGPGGFYRACGFAETGEIVHGERVIRLPL